MVLIQDHIDIQDKSFVINGIAKPDGIGNLVVRLRKNMIQEWTGTVLMYV